MAKQWAVVLAVLYVVYGGLLMGFQERLIFPRGVPGARDALAPVRPGWEALAVAGEDGSRVPAWLKLPEQRRAGEKVPAVVFFHGNAEVIDDIADSDEVDMYPAMGIAVLLVEYRGYGRAGGAPSEKAIVADGVRFVDMLLKREEIDGTRVVFHGRSLGGGVACAVAKHRPPRAMVLQSTFYSLRSMAAGFGAPGFLVRHPFRNDEFVREFDGPILFMHGTEDDVIACSNTQRLAAIARHGRVVTQTCGHNDFPADMAAYRREVEAFLRENGVVGGGE